MTSKLGLLVSPNTIPTTISCGGNKESPPSVAGNYVHVRIMVSYNNIKGFMKYFITSVRIAHKRNKIVVLLKCLEAQSKARVYTMRVPKFYEKGLKIYIVSRT